jgi:hypothetical protein
VDQGRERRRLRDGHDRLERQRGTLASPAVPGYDIVIELDPASNDNRRDTAGFCLRELHDRAAGADEATLGRLA